MQKIIAFFLFLFLTATAFTQKHFSFVQITDLHIGGSTAADDLRRTVQELNNNDTIQFVLATGDITEFGSEKEITLARQILDSLNKPWYIVPGNHDSNWSESGTNDFLRIFGSEAFAFNHGGYYFIGNASGPNMRMSPGQIPYEHIVWMDSVLNKIPKDAPVIYINHYPVDSSLNNWYDVIDRLKQHNIQMTMGGHWHTNKVVNWEGIPGVIARSNLRAKDTTGGYNIVTFKDQKAIFQSKKTFSDEIIHWATIDLKNHFFKNDTTTYTRPSFAVNNLFPQVKNKWMYQIKADVGSGFALKNNVLVTPDTKGNVYAFDLIKKKIIWQNTTNGKIYSAPAIEGNDVVVSSTDGNVYCYDLSTGKQKWKFAVNSPIVSSPVIFNNQIFIGSSGGNFRSLDLLTGKQLWIYNDVKDFIITTPTIHEGVIYFGCWGNEYYALDTKTGKEIWKFRDGYSNRMLSPAACIARVADDKLFIVAPDRHMSALRIKDGKQIWKKKWENDWVRESMGISADKKMIFAKTMQGDVIGVPASVSENPDYTWKTNFSLGYELNPAPVTEYNGLIFALSDKGVVAAYNRQTADIQWAHKVSNTLINMIKPLSANQYVLTTMDGKLIVLEIDK